MLAILFPNIDPIIFSIGQLSLRWYGVAYALGIIISLYLIRKLSDYKNTTVNSISAAQIDSLAIYIICGILLGGRLGFVLFYRPHWFLERPLMVLNTLEGGMSFHGALIGLIITLLIFCKRHKIDFLFLTDLVCITVPVGLFFGRCANFINAELYGRVTNVQWGVIFPGDTLPRHPSQIYEALTEGILLFLIMILLFFKTNLRNKKGALSGVFLIGYSISRIVIEQYREPDSIMGYFFFITIGQALSIPMLIGGIFLILQSLTDKSNHHQAL